MKKLTVFVILIVSIVFTSCVEDNKKEINGFTLNISLNNLNSSTVYLFNSKNKLVDSALVSDNYTSFSGSVDSIHFYKIQFKNNDLKIPVLLENQTFYIYASKFSQKAFGGSLQNLLNSYNEELSLIQNKLIGYNIDQNKKEIDSIKTLIFNFNLAKIEESIHAPISNYIFNNTLNISDLDKENLLNLKSISENLNQNQWLSKVILEIERLDELELLAAKELEATKKPIVIKRRKAPLFSGESLNNSNLSLQTALKEKKAVLIDFWASWCGPCRTAAPQIRNIYNRYKNKGFDIITVSEDKTRAAWTNGIAQDNMLDWNHIYDDDMRIAYMFNVQSIPHMILLDENGGIIENKISLYRLEKELKKIFN